MERTRTATAGGIPLQLRAVSARVAKLLTITGMDGLLPGKAAAEGPDC